MNFTEQDIDAKVGSVEIHQDRPDELINKTMYGINTFQAHEDEIYLRGKDEYDNDFQICFNSYDFLEWIDKEKIDYIKEQLTKYIQKK
tara:strand:+ start:556 stop:819 length:264 start_codon:yes stop_codon:yes gene_type:complete